MDREDRCEGAACADKRDRFPMPDGPMDDFAQAADEDRDPEEGPHASAAVLV